MRAFFLFLVLLNLSYFAIGDILAPSTSSGRAHQVASALPSGVQALHMIGTASAAVAQPFAPIVAASTSSSATSTQESSTQVAVKAQPALCYSLGPFGDRASADAMIAVFKQRDVKAALRQIQQKQVTGYWIYLRPYPSTATAMAATRELGAKGLHDYYVVATAPNVNAISLGLFRERSGAERRLEQVRKMGFQPKLQVRTSDKLLYWLDYQEPGDGAIGPSLWAKTSGDGGALQRVKRICAAGG